MPFGKISRRHTVYALISACVVAGGLFSFLYYKPGERTQPQIPVVSSDKENLFLYVPTERGGLEKKALEVRSSLSERAKADILFQELRKAKAIPVSTQLHELAFGEGAVLYLDISHDVVEQQLDARGEIRVVYALVNSFIASFRDVNRVQLLVDGRPLYTFSGVVYTFAPLPFNNDVQEE